MWLRRVRKRTREWWWRREFYHEGFISGSVDFDGILLLPTQTHMLSSLSESATCHYCFHVILLLQVLLLL